MDRPKVALIVTSYFGCSHADVAGTRLIEGYPWQGRHVDPRVEVVSMYLEQFGDHGGPDGRRPDVGVAIADRNGVPLYPTVAEAIGCGRGGVAVDGVVIIGEHGDYELNEYGQKLYPRRRLFDAALSTMISAGRFVPVYIDKHLSWSFADARAMYDSAVRLGVPLLAGSSVPVAYRIPTGAQWPFGAPMSDLVLVGYGPLEIYGFHNLEAAQAIAERRAGGESGVVSVRGLTGQVAARAITDGVRAELFAEALATFDLEDGARERAHNPQEVFQVEYRDGLRVTVVNCNGALKGFAVAGTGPADELCCQLWLQDHPHSHFIFLVRQIESLMLEGRSPYPVERTLLTTGMLDAALHSLHDGGVLLRTPELGIAYEPVDEVPDTGIDLPLPGPGEPGSCALRRLSELQHR